MKQLGIQTLCLKDKTETGGVYAIENIPLRAALDTDFRISWPISL